MGKITSMQCPNCGASVTPPENGQKMMFCPYCATPLEYDDGDINININKNIKKVKHTIDHAKMAELEYKDREDKRTWIAIGLMFVPFLIMCIWYFGGRFIRDTTDKAKAGSYIEQGYVCPGKSAEDFEGDNIKSVIKQLESVGFTNIEKVATGGGIAVWSWGDVTEVMIDGDNDFGPYAYFPPDAPIVVTYK